MVVIELKKKNKDESRLRTKFLIKYRIAAAAAALFIPIKPKKYILCRKKE